MSIGNNSNIVPIELYRLCFQRCTKIALPVWYLKYEYLKQLQIQTNIPP